MRLFRRTPDPRLYDLLEEAGTNVERTSDLLRDMFEGFPDGRDHLAREILKCEQEGDRLSRDAIASLFARGVDPMVVIRWKDIVESLEQAIDSCETAAHVLEGAELDRH